MRLILDGNLVLAAGAGSGKTHALVTVALGLYGGAGGRAPLEPSRVWAVTFTEKAAAELLSRIADRARRLARGEPDPDVEAILDGKIAPRAHWDAVVRALGAAPIGNFHSLCGQLLRRHAAEAGIDPRFQILDERVADELFTDAREEALLAALADADDGARRLVRTLGSLDATRGALTLLHYKLGEEGRDPGSLVDGSDGKTLPPFDRDAALAELAQAGEQLRAQLEPLAAVTHERLAATVAACTRERTRLANCSPDRLDDWYPAAFAVDKAPRGKGTLPKICKAPWEAFKQAWEAAQSAVARVAQAEAGRDLSSLLTRVEEAYRVAKRERGALDFADLVRRARDLLRDDREVRREAKAHVGALLVDEFQDTNRLQLDLCHLLGEARDRERPVGPDGASALPLADAVLCVVGDRKQSIYEFRGADVSVFGELSERARRGDGLRLQTLARSYRSLPSLVAFANRAFANILGPRSDGIFVIDAPYQVRWLPNEDPLEAARSDGGAGPAIELLDGGGDLSAAERRPAEAARVARRVATLLASGRLIEPKGEAPRAVRGSDVAILFRAFTAVDTYRHELTRLGIATVVSGGRNFHGAREIRDLAALLSALADPYDRFASAAVYRSPAGGLSDDALALLAAADALPLSRHAEGCCVSLPPADERRLNHLGPLFHRLSREVDRLGPARALRLAIDELDLFPSLAATFDGEQRIANVRKLLASLETVVGGAAYVATRLLALADAERDAEPPADVAAAADPRAVRILTVHAAKGLEFPVVIVAELGANERNETGAVLFDRRLGLAVKATDPLGERHGDRHFDEVQRELTARRDAEAARLFYVAATRARDLLILCGERGKSGGFCWRELLDRALPSLDEPLARPPAEPAREPPPRPDPILFPIPTKEALALVAHAQPPRIAGARLIAAVTDLAALDRCERRYFYRALVGLEEYLQGGSLLGALTDEDADAVGLDRLARGTLAHLLLERADLALAAHSPSEAVRRAALGEGLDLAHPELLSIGEDASALLAGALGRVMTAKETPRVYRELPFALDVTGPRGGALTVKGKIDLLFVDGEGAINVVDYKHASQKGQPADAFAFQLRTYALAARRVLPGEVALRAGVAWLRDRDASPALLPVDGEVLAAHETRLAALADRLAEAHRENRWEKLSSRAACQGCGYVPRCWGKAPPRQLTLFGDDPLLEADVPRRRR